MRAVRFKPVLVLLAVLVLTLTLLNLPAAASEEIEQLQPLVDKANNYVFEKFGFRNFFTPTNQAGMPLRGHILRSDILPGEEFPMLVWGSWHGSVTDGRARFIGYGYYGEDVTNVEFPPDRGGGGKSISEFNWIRQPWKNPSIWRAFPNYIKDPAFDGRTDPDLIERLRWGIDYTCWPNGFTLDTNADVYQNPQEYVHITIPPAPDMWGMGVMFHDEGNGIWYVSVPLPPRRPQVPDFYVKIEPAGAEAEPGQGLTFTATYGLKNTIQQPWRALLRAHHVTNAEYPVVLEPLNGAPVPSDEGVLFQPGQEFQYRLRVTAQDADSKVVARINPMDISMDANWSDNRAEAPITVARQFVPGDKRLTLQAYSKAGEDVYGNWRSSIARPPFTAKWTDDVHATLTVERPVPPRGTLDWWEITWARITYPKRHPNFVFANPLPPSGTVTKNMNVPGRGLEATKQARIVFEEDWALDGFPVYNMETGETMAQNPKNYPITVQYKVTYQYHYYAGDPPTRIEVIDSYTDSVTANLLVNGTGTVPYSS